MKIKEFILENQNIADTVLTHAKISDLFVTLEQLANQIGSNKNLLGKITGAAQGAAKGAWQGLKSAGKAIAKGATAAAKGANYAYNKAQGNPQYDDQTGGKLYEVLNVKEWLKGISAKRLESKWKSVGSPDSLPEIFDFLNREVGSQALVGAAFNKMGMKPQYDYIKNAVATNPNAASSGSAQQLYSQGKLVPNQQQASQPQTQQPQTQDISQRLDNIEKRLNAANLEESVELDENLRAWFGKGKEGGAGGGGWDRYNTKGERIGKCGEKKPGEGKPKCLSKQKANQLRAKGGKKAIATAVNKKRREDPNPDRKGGAKMVSNNIKKESLQYYVENRECPHCHGLMFSEDQLTEAAKKDACYHKVKSRYKVWPSAYASGALVKCRKAGAKNWGNK